MESDEHDYKQEPYLLINKYVVTAPRDKHEQTIALLHEVSDELRSLTRSIESLVSVIEETF